MSAVYTRTLLKASVESLISGEIAATTLDEIVNRAVRGVLSEIDLRSSKRKTSLSPDLFDDIFDYSAPSDLKERGIVDVKPQIHRGRFDQWRLTTEEEFDRLKEDNRLDKWGDPIKVRRGQWMGESLVAVSDRDMVKKIKLTRPIDDDSVTIDPLDSVGTWTGFGDGENLTRDADDYVKGSAAINWDINADGGTTAGIVNVAVSSFDVSDYKTTGSVFVWAYISSPTNLTNFIIRLGSSASTYYSITITTNNEGNAFEDGWNLLRFDFVNKATTGSVTDASCVYVALYMTKAGAKISETDYRFDQIVMKRGEKYDLIYYSKYFWQNAAGTYLENSTADTDYLNCDTDETSLIENKCAEIAERHLKNHSEANMYRELYKVSKKEYQQKNPSEGLCLSNTYHFI